MRSQSRKPLNKLWTVSNPGPRGFERITRLRVSDLVLWDILVRARRGATWHLTRLHRDETLCGKQSKSMIVQQTRTIRKPGSEAYKFDGKKPTPEQILNLRICFACKEAYAVMVLGSED